MNRIAITTIAFSLFVAACATTTQAPPTFVVTLPPPAVQQTTVPPPATEPTQIPTTEVPAVPGATHAPTEDGYLQATEAATATAAASPTPGIAYMTFQDFAILPSQITITPGTKIVFLIKSASGTFHEPYSSFPNNFNLSGLFDSGALRDGDSYAYTFAQAGTYTVRCGYHPDIMVSTVEVTP
ncbi:MAG: hypothetical protein AAB427_14460 [Chloroflexota bacterium]